MTIPIIFSDNGGRTVYVDEQVLHHIDQYVREPNGRIRLMPIAEWKQFHNDHIRIWMHRAAIYSVPTLELVEWLKARIDGRKAIEIGAGNADLYYHLGIVGTDSLLQRDMTIALWMKAAGHMPTNPPDDILPLDGNTAIHKLRPKVVIGSYITRRFVEGIDVDGKSQASIFGVNDEDIIENCQTYIHIGNRKVHGEKTALALPHMEIPGEGLVISRGMPEHDVIYVWGK